MEKEAAQSELDRLQASVGSSSSTEELRSELDLERSVTERLRLDLEEQRFVMYQVQYTVQCAFLLFRSSSL